MITTELGFIYIAKGRRFVTRKEAEEYAQQKGKIQKAGKKKEKLRDKEI